MNSVNAMCAEANYRIVFVCNEYPPAPGGGIGIFVRSLAVGLQSIGCKVAVIGFDPNVEHDVKIDDEGVTVLRLANPYSNRMGLRIGRYYLNFESIVTRKYLSRRLEQLITEFKPDFVESYDWSGPLWSKPSVPLVVRMHGAHTAHGYFEGKRSSRLLRYFERRNLTMADMCCAVSNHIGNITVEAFNLKRSFDVLYNFVRPEIFKPIAGVGRHDNRILYVGRIDRRKGVIELFKVLNELFRINPAVTCALVGPLTDALHLELLNLISSKERHRVIFLGRINHRELPAIYSSASLFVMPSRAEAFGLTAAEAMSCETPVALADRASSGELVIHGDSGLLLNFFEAKNTAEIINDWLRHPEKLRKLGTQGRQTVVERFSRDLALSRNLSFYSKLCSKQL